MVVRGWRRARRAASRPDDPATGADGECGDGEGRQRQQERGVAVHGRVSGYRNALATDRMACPGGTLTRNGGAVDLAGPPRCPYARDMDIGSAPPDALRLRGVRKTFEATDDEQVPVRALRGVDLAVDPGAFVAIMGPSGCGKSTLLNLVAGLDAPTDGEIVVAGEPIAGLSDDELAVMRRRHIGIVFQFFNLLEGMTVRENVALPGRGRGPLPRAGGIPSDGSARPARDRRQGGEDPRACCRAGSASGCRSPARSRTSRRCCSPTSPRARSTRPAASRSSSCSGGCTTAGRRSSW